MTEAEVNKAFDALKAQGADEQDILGTLYMMYEDEKISTDELRDLVDILGYEFTPEFEAMSEEDKHTKGWKSDEEKAEGVTNEEVEDAKEIDSEEKKEEESKTETETETEKEEGSKTEETEEKSETETKTEEKEPEEDSEEEKKKAFGYFGFNK